MLMISYDLVTLFSDQVMINLQALLPLRCYDLATNQDCNKSVNRCNGGFLNKNLLNMHYNDIGVKPLPKLMINLLTDAYMRH